MLLGMGIVSVVSHIRSKQALTGVITDEIENVTQTTASSMNAWISDRKLDLGNWSKQGVYRKALLNSFLGLTARTFANEQLARIKQDYGYYEDIVLADNSGDIVAASDGGLIGRVNVADRDYYKMAYQDQIYVTRHALKSKIRGNMILVVSAPVKDDQTVVGVLFAVFDVNQLVGQFINDIRIGDSGYAYVVMDRGYIVCSKKCDRLSGRNINDFDFAKKILSPSDTVVRYPLDGIKMIASFRPLAPMNWRLVVCAVENEIFRPVHELGRINAIVTVAVALAVALVIILVTHTVSKPIKDVVSGLKRMGEGHLDVRLAYDKKDEIGRIGRALNLMAQNLEASDRKIKHQNMMLKEARDKLELRVEQRTHELQRAEKKYRAIFENAIEGIFQATMDGRIINANPSLARTLGYHSVSHMFSGSGPVLFPVSELEGMKIKEELSRKGNVVAYETRLKRKDGEWFWCSLSVGKIYSEEDRGLYCEGFVVDITERREKEKAQREIKAAQAASRAKSEFLANMSHEIRTPLNTLLGFSELLAVDLNDPTQEKYIEAMRTSGNSLLTLINDILDLSKIEAGKMVFKFEPVNLKILCSEIRYIFNEKVKGKNLTFSFEVDDNLPESLLLDETRVRQILLNLVGNAVKFTEQGSITLKVSGETVPEKAGINLVFRVTDTGPGIEPAYQDSIFESFKQVNGQINRQHGGTGLGLAICKRLTEAMNGRISVESKPGEGSRFTIRLNDVEIPEGPIVSSDHHVSLQANGSIFFERKRILIVDDTPLNLMMLKELLIRFNQEVIEATNGLEAVEKTKSEHPDLIIMDIRMPGMDGNEATERIKADPQTHAIPIIAFTGDVVARTKTGALKKGYDGYLTKPVKIDELTRELSRFIKMQEKIKNQVLKTVSWDNFSHTKIREPQKFVRVIEKEILPSARSCQSSIVINQVKDFSIRLKELSKQHEVEPLKAFSEQLMESADLFDITHIERKMADLPDLLEKLIKRL